MTEHDDSLRPPEPAANEATGSMTPTDVPPVPVAPVQPGRGPARRGRRTGLVLAVGLLAVALVGTAVFAGARLLTPPATGDSLANWAPADTIIYAEARLDLPGDQQANLGAFLGHFPGYEDTPGGDAALSDSLDWLIATGTDDEQYYTNEIKPWSTGEIAMAASDLPPVTRGMDREALRDLPHEGLMIVGVTDQAAASAWLDEIAAEADTPPTSFTHGGARVLESEGFAGAALPNVLLLGDVASVTAAIDRNGKGGLATQAGFAAAASALDPDNLGSFYVNGARYLDAALARAGEAGAKGAALAECLGTGDLMPAWIGGALRAETDALAGEGAMPHVDRRGATTNARSALPGYLPASTLVLLDGHQVGQQLDAGLDRLRSCEDDALDEMLGKLDVAAGVLGGWDTIAGALGEAAIVLDRDGERPTGGLIFVPADRAAVDQLFVQAGNLAALAGGRVTLTEQIYGGETLNVVEPEAESADDMPSFAWVVTDEFVAIGLESWVKAVVDTKASASLANDARFTSALGRVDAEHAGLMYVNVADLVDWAADVAAESDRSAKFDQAVPFLEPLESIIVTSTVGGDLDRVSGVLVVK